MKRYFDVIAVVPLEEEFEIVTEAFKFVEGLTTDRHIRFAMSLPEGGATRILLVKQAIMGRTGCLEAASESLDHFDCGILVCIGIAGAISPDLSIGDVCYSRDICDVLDNAKILDAPKKRAEHLAVADLVSLAN